MIGLPVVIQLAKKIYQHAENVKFNKEQVKYLAKRINTIQVTLSGLKSPPTGASFTKALQDVYSTLQKIEVLLQKLSGKSWFTRVVRAKYYRERLISLNSELRENIQQLNLGLNIQQLFDQANDKKAWQEDLASVKKHQQEIIELNKKYFAKLNQSRHEKELANKLTDYQLQSFKGEMNSLLQPSPVKKNNKPEVSQSAFFVKPKIEEDAEEKEGEGEEENSDKNNNENFFILPMSAHIAFCELIFKETWLKTTNLYTGQWFSQEVLIHWLEDLPEKLLPAFKAESQRRYQWRNEHLLLFHGHCAKARHTCWVSSKPAYTLEEALTTDKIKEPLTIAIQIAQGLAYLHRHQQCHGWLAAKHVGFNDVGQVKLYGMRPQNAVLADYIAKRLAFDDFCCAPELLGKNAKNSVASASDVYGFGLLLVALITKEVPTSNGKPEVIIKKVQENCPANIAAKSLITLLSDCLAVEPGKRPTMLGVLIRLKTLSINMIKLSKNSDNQKEINNDNHNNNEGMKMYQMGMTYERSGQLKEAFEHYQQAASKGHIKAKTNLAQCYLQGLGCDKSSSKALELLTQAANAGHGRAQYNLGMLLEYGANDVEVNLSEALMWYQKAKAQNYQPPKGMKSVVDKIARLKEKMEQTSVLPFKMGGF